MYLFDTDTLSNIVKRKPSGRLLEKLEETPKAFQYTSAINVGEIYYGANKSSKKKQILKAFEETNRVKPIKGRRFALIHAYQPSEENFKQCYRLGVVVASQPSFIHYLGASFYENVGHERSKWLKPHRAWIEHGIMVASGTDSPVTPYPPFPSLWASIVRKTEVKGIQMGIEQKISREEAVKLYTVNGAYHTFEEYIKGSIEPGKLADLIVIDRDIMECPEDDIKDTKVLMTILGGKTVYKT